MSLAGDGISSGPAAAAMASGCHLLTVNGYSRIKEGTRNGRGVLSRPFIVGGYRWRIKFYRLTKVEKHVSSRVLARESREFSSDHPCWTLKAFIRRKAFEKSKHLKGDSFTIRCDITITKNGNTARHTAGAPASAAVPTLDIQHHLLSLLRSGKGSDVTFEVNGETIAAHRCVLAARSSVLAAELFGPMKEGTTSGVISVAEMEARVFRLLLDFIYSDSVPVIEEEEGEQDVIWQHLLAAADRYDLQRLRLMCEEKLAGYMNTRTVATILAVAEQHSCQGLKEACLDFLRSPQNMQQVMATGGFDLLTKTCPSVLKELITKLLG
ncbi:unnamed protein product [Urochloa decumbens]|uniref:BTB domain-containing protein n=1 Tax=Urochloa decumbens TaxID=240449 RepID=A0ABC8XYD4_9POAL